MNKTRRLILDNALKLFNDKGYAEVSMRDIADFCEISPGNLTYHFKRRESILEELYLEFTQDVGKQFAELKLEEISLKVVLDLIQLMTTSRIKYRFLMRDFISITASNKRIQKHYQSLLSERESQILLVFQTLIKQKILRPEELNREYQHLYGRIQIFGNYWISFAAMNKQKLTEENIADYQEMMEQIIYPYLTSSGKSAWKKIR